MAHQRDPWTWAGIVAIGVTALVWSFTALSDLARLVGVTTVFEVGGLQMHVAWGLPITIDVFAVIATRVWLRGRAVEDAIRFARRAAWSAIAATVAGNGYHGLITGNFKWDALIISAVPAVVIGAIVHLAVLVGRPPAPAVDEPAVDRWAQLLDDVLAEPWDQAIARWAARVDAAGQPIPSRDQHDEILAVDLRAVGAARGRPLTQDEVRDRYGVGAGRAARLRGMAEQPPAVEQVA